MKRSSSGKSSDKSENPSSAASTTLRIIGGDLRGRKLEYHGDSRTRPMKDRVRQAVFNLVADGSQGRFAIDLFAGTGALGLEAVSRGSAGALFIERHFPTAKVVEHNAQQLGIAAVCRILPGSAFVWARRPDAPLDKPWLVFCSPPYEFYVSRKEDMLDLIERILASAPPESMVVVESDPRFDTAELPRADQWDTRSYPPAVISILNST